MSASQTEFRSNNLSKWSYPNALYQRVLGRYLSRTAALVRAVAPATVLDAGCGEGFVHRGLVARGVRARWTGIDVSPGAIAFAASRDTTGGTWKVADLHATGYPDASFDLVLCSQVLEHIAAAEQVRDELGRLTRRWLLLTVPLEPWFRRVCAVAVGLRIGADPGHVHFWDAAAFRRFVSPLGRLQHWERTAVYQIALIERLL